MEMKTKLMKKRKLILDDGGYDYENHLYDDDSYLEGKLTSIL